MTMYGAVWASLRALAGLTGSHSAKNRGGNFFDAGCLGHKMWGLFFSGVIIAHRRVTRFYGGKFEWKEICVSTHIHTVSTT